MYLRTLAKLIFLLVLTGCASLSVSNDRVIDLTSLQPLPARSGEGVTPLRISVAAIISPRGTAENYQPLLDYLSRTVNRPVELIQRRTYQETNDLIQRGEVDIAFVCTSAYIIGREAFDMKLLAAPEVSGASVYYSLLIVPINSSATSMEELKGRIFAFTDPISFSGRVYPTYLVRQLGKTPETFFARTFFTYSHDDAIRAVADGVADAAAVDSLVYDAALKREPTLVARVKVIHRSPPFGIPPIVVSPTMRPQQQARIQELLLSMHSSSDGRAALQAMGIDRFISIENSAYQSARQVINLVGTLSP